jgi:hypothetical protein
MRRGSVARESMPLKSIGIFRRPKNVRLKTNIRREPSLAKDSQRRTLHSLTSGRGRQRENYFLLLTPGNLCYPRRTEYVCSLSDVDYIVLKM